MDVRSRFATNPAPVYLILILALALFSLQSSPSSDPLILLLAILRLFVVHVVARENTRLYFVLTVLLLAAATTTANIGPSLDAHPFVQPTLAVVSLVILTSFSSAFVLFTILLDATLKPSAHRQWAHFLLFPTIWSTALQIAALISPIGYLATWTPVLGVGTEAYSWLRPIFGTVAIDWAVGAWAVIFSELIGMWIMGPEGTLSVGSGAGEDLLVSVEEIEPSSEVDKTTSQRSSRLLFVFTILCIGALPSQFTRPLPIPVNSESTARLSVGCALPLPTGNLTKPTFKDYKRETQKLVGLAKVILWPEGAVRFNSTEQKNEAVRLVSEHADRSLIAMSFEDYAEENGQVGKLRNGIMLIGREEGVIFEYYKRHLVPFVESQKMIPYHEPPPIFDYELVIKESSRGRPIESRSLPITTSICLDFAHPNIFNELDQRPSLILAPASTWHESIGVAMWQQALARAEEIGSTVLFCDGGVEGISGIGGEGAGKGEIIQVGRGSWTRTVGFTRDVDKTRTLYGQAGPWFSMCIVWCILGAEGALELLMFGLFRNKLEGEMSSRRNVSFIRENIGRLKEWWRERRGAGVNERTSLLL